MRRLVLLVTSVLVLAAAAPVQATPSTPVSITGTIVFTPTPPATGTFTSTLAGCPEGTIEELGGVFAGFQSNRFARIGVRHLFTCANGTGSFVLQLTVRLDFETGTTEFQWTVLSGTGDYATLHGVGTGTGAPIPGGIVDSYTGVVHFD
jgi:hypothetical protein